VGEGATRKAARWPPIIAALPQTRVERICGGAYCFLPQTRYAVRPPPRRTAQPASRLSDYQSDSQVNNPLVPQGFAPVQCDGATRWGHPLP
jgi:hypothetical protein